eukprot:GFUD01029609.1.p1 GENE.GFUD01029609.1~~GFUD01029609.1.p1  ORF type:complete len:463 (+),score=141.61 GFUD01029609.1:102-1490(+)
MGIQSFKFLADDLPGFKVHGSQIKIIQEPKQFYMELLDRSLASKNRIVMSALYLGTEEKEKRLVEAVGESLERNNNLRVKILLDWCRGTREVEGESSASILAQLKSKACDRCRISLYHTPYLRGLWKKCLPSKWNETVGLQHCKVYVFDDSLIISGANLSRDYFSARQDRYVVIEDCPGLADYYEGLVDTISTFSLGLDREEGFGIEQEFGSHPYQGQLSEFVEESSGLVRTFLEDQKLKNKADLEDFDTVVFPSVQMGQLNITQDSEITSKILTSGEPGGMFHFATGYFNLTDQYMEDMITKSQSKFSLLMAHPQANGFLGARGLAGGVPHAYTLIAQTFWNLVLSNNQQQRIKMFEYQREGWTFHAKGLWYSSSPSMSLSSLPCLTMVGSPNYGYRSVYKDLETQVTILTTNCGLQEQLREEQNLLYKQGKEVNSITYQQEERRVPLWVKMVVGLTRKFF